MKEKPGDKARLLHIRDAILEIKSYTKGYDITSFAQDSKTRFATIKQLEIIGESAYHLTDGLKNQFPEVAWNATITLRHILVHEYYGIQSDILWRIITTHLPVFEQQVNTILKNYSEF